MTTYFVTYSAPRVTEEVRILSGTPQDIIDELANELDINPEDHTFDFVEVSQDTAQRASSDPAFHYYGHLAGR
jgi:hypothetical protein